MRLFLVFALVGCALAGAARGDNPRLDGDGNPLPEGAVARLGTLNLRGCGDPLLYSADGKYFIATAGPSRSQVAFFDPQTRKRLFELATSGTGARLVFSPDGTRLTCPVPGGQQNQVWDVVKRAVLFKFEGSQAAFSTDGRRLLTVSYLDRGSCRVLDGHSGKLLEEHALGADLSWAEVVPGSTKVAYHDKSLGRLAIFDWARNTRMVGISCPPGFGGTASPDGKTLAVADRGGVRLVDTATGAEQASWKQRADGAVAFSPDGRRVAWGGWDDSRGVGYPWIVEVDGSTPRRAGPPTISFTPPCFTPDSTALVVLEDGGAPIWLDVVTGKEIRQRYGHAASVLDVVPLQDGRYLLSRDHHRHLLWDLGTHKVEKRYPDGLPLGEVPLYRGARLDRMLTLDDDTGVLRLRDLATGREIVTLEGRHGAQPPVMLAKDSKTAALVSRDGQIRAYDLETGKIRFTHNPMAAIWSLEISQDGCYLKWIAQSRRGGDGPFFLDTRTGQPVEALQPTTSQYWSFWGQEEGLRHLRERKLRDPAGRLIGPAWPRSVFAIVPSPDERFLAVHYSDAALGQKGDGRLSVWDVATGRLLSYLNIQQGPFRFSPDSRLLAATTLDGAVQVWEIATGQECFRGQGHLSGEVPALAFLPDGRTLVSGGRDGQVFLWDLTGRAPDGVWRDSHHDLARLKELWAALLSTDAASARRAIWELTADPTETVAFLSGRLAPMPGPGGSKTVAQLIIDLDSPIFSTRQHASQELARWSEAALPEIRAALKRPTSLEQSRRLEPLLADLERLDLSGERLRGARAIEVLERIGTPRAREILAKLAHGFSESRLTEEAKRALGRLR